MSANGEQGLGGVLFGRASAVLTAALASCLLLASSAYAEDDKCVLRANKPPLKGKKLRPPITLTAEPGAEIVNFGASRGTKSLYVVLKASRPLPGNLKPGQLELAVPRPPRRVSDTLESASLDFPRFSKPRFINGRREIQFRVCVDAAAAEPGTYSSQVFVSGPKGLSGTSVTATITAKEQTWFLIGFVVVLGAALVLLIAIVQQDMRRNTTSLKVITVLGSLVAAGGAMYAIYSADPAWGADPIAGVFALGGTAFGAAGVGSFVTTILRRGQEPDIGKKEEDTT